MNNGQAPATKQDLAELKKELLAANDRLKVELKEELLEAMHDIETHLLKGFYGYTESTQKHLNQLDREDGSVRERLGTLEVRVKELERRVQFPRFTP